MAHGWMRGLFIEFTCQPRFYVLINSSNETEFDPYDQTDQTGARAGPKIQRRFGQPREWVNLGLSGAAPALLLVTGRPPLNKPVRADLDVFNVSFSLLGCSDQRARRSCGRRMFPLAIEGRARSDASVFPAVSGSVQKTQKVSRFPSVASAGSHSSSLSLCLSLSLSLSLSLCLSLSLYLSLPHTHTHTHSLT